MEKFKPHPKFWAMLALIIGGFLLVFLAGALAHSNPKLSGALMVCGSICVSIACFTAVIDALTP